MSGFLPSSLGSSNKSGKTLKTHWQIYYIYLIYIYVHIHTYYTILKVDDSAPDRKWAYSIDGAGFWVFWHQNSAWHHSGVSCLVAPRIPRISQIWNWKLDVCLKCSISKCGEYVGFMPSIQEFLIPKDWEKDGSAHFESARIDGADIWEFDTSVTSQALFHSWLHHLCQESRKPEIEMFDVYFKCCSHWLPCKIFEISPSWGLRHRTIYSCIFLGFGWVWSSCHLFPRYFGGFLGDPAFSAVFWGDLQPLLGGCAIYSCLFGVWLGLHVLHSVLVDFLGIPPFQSAVFWGDLQHLTANFGGCAIYACTFSFHLVCMGNGTSIPTVFWWFIVDASISAQPLLGVAPCIPRFWGLVGFTGVHTGMEHLFP